MFLLSRELSQQLPSR